MKLHDEAEREGMNSGKCMCRTVRSQEPTRTVQKYQ